MTHFIEPKTTYPSKAFINIPVNLCKVEAISREVEPLSSGDAFLINFHGTEFFWAYESAEDRDKDWERILRGE